LWQASHDARRERGEVRSDGALDEPSECEQSLSHPAELGDSHVVVDVGQPLHRHLVGEIEPHAAEALAADRDLPPMS
jgi:hypothetical protein